MDNKDKQAFAAIATDGNEIYRQSGLTKREYFAAMAMQGFCSIPNTGLTAEGFAKKAIQIADALLAELEK